MKIEAEIEQFISDNLAPQILSKPLPDDVAIAVIDHLKQEADRYWLIDPNRSLELANRIVSIGQARADSRQTALGLMARGDALKFLGQMAEAWEAIDKAGRLFQMSGDEIGWARTRIGRLYLAVKLNRIEDTLSEAEQARAIFLRYGEREKLMRLSMNTALAYTWLGRLDDALCLYHSALETAESLGEVGRQYFGQLFLNIGLTYETIGDFRQALSYYERARTCMTNENQTRNNTLLEINIALIARTQGNYPNALDMLYKVIEQAGEELPWETTVAKRDLLECYLELNRYAEARELARQVVAEYRAFNAPYDLARTLLHMATAEAEAGNYGSANVAVAEAEKIFDSLDALSWIATTQLLRGQIALKEGDAAAAYRNASVAAHSFQSIGQQLNYSKAILLQGQALAGMMNYAAAATAGANALRIAQHSHVPSLRYASHLLLGRVSEAQNRTKRALHHYQAAAATVGRVQRGLSITLRPGFLEDKGEAWRALIALYLRTGQAQNAFETLERAKSQVLLGYLTNRENLHWSQDDARGLALIEELNQLRAEHHWFYRLAHEPPRNPDRPNAVRPEQALVEIAVRERRMRAITEQLYLRGGNGQMSSAPSLDLQDIQHTLSQETLLVEFYNDGTQLWAFVLDGQRIHVHCLPMTVDKLNQLLSQLQVNVAAALQADSRTIDARRLTPAVQRILQRLYSLLIEPLGLSSYRGRRLIIVPYGGLHYLPFHVLYDGTKYLIEQYEVVILPASGLATRPRVRQKPGALILAHSWDGRLPQTLAEAQIVKNLFSGEVYADEMTQRSILHRAPSQILHIAAHGEHRLDQPDLSYLQLADGHLYADDLLQQNLGYEMVTLSGCETGRANVSGGDELIGLGRGFLYAGAGALMVSLWKVADDSTLHFMQRMYQALRAGDSKAAALRKAQREMLSQDRGLHPAFWGAFQLIGDAGPLSTPVDQIDHEGSIK